MNKGKIIKTGLAGLMVVFLLIIVFLFVMAGAKQDIIIKKDFEKNLKAYSHICIDAQNDKFKDLWQRSSDLKALFIRSEIHSIMISYDLKYEDGENCNLKIESTVKTGSGLPWIGRHFDMHLEHIKFVNIKFIDNNTMETIGEVEYKKPFLSGKSHDIVRRMIDKLFVKMDKQKK